jgi:hypothetical protein
MSALEIIGLCLCAILLGACGVLVVLCWRFLDASLTVFKGIVRDARETRDGMLALGNHAAYVDMIERREAEEHPESETEDGPPPRTIVLK